VTPEERAKALLRKIDACDCVPCINEVAAVIRAIYEDAAKIAEGEWSEDVARHPCRATIAAAIRARTSEDAK
jgi:hypothetical protein